MNLNVTITTNGTLLDTDGNPILLSGEVSHNILLSPLFATERDVLSAVLDESSPYYDEMARNIIFNSSISATDRLSDRAFKRWGLSKENIFRIRRQYTICLSIYNFAKRFNRDYAGSIKKSKFIGDIKVSLDVQGDPTFILAMINDAKECFLSIEKEINQHGAGMALFVMGANTETAISHRTDRLWMLPDGKGGPRVSIAANKAMKFNHRYKIGKAGAPYAG